MKIKIPIKYCIVVLLLVSAFLRLYRLDYPKGYVFDEVYHAFTAREYLSLHKEAWEWWTTPPSGVAYEWTHPPLSKEIMAISMFFMHTQDAWAWRLPGAILGVLSVFLVYLLAVRLLNNKVGALIAAFVFSVDGLNFVQSRTGMNDIYYVTFFLASLFFIIKKKYALSAIFIGLALASKWAVIYSFLLLIPILIKYKQYKSILYFITIPPIIYLLSYFPFFLFGHSPQQFLHLQQQMWWYHTGLKATHNYASAWWSWPLNLYPVWYFVDYQGKNMANIFTSGNPLMFWAGSIALLFTVWDIVKKRSLNFLITKGFNLLIIVMGFIIFWLPWAFSPRIMFLYHFSPSVPFLSLALGYRLSVEFKNHKGRKYVIALLVLIALSFFLMFPFLTGIPFPREFIKIFFSTNLSKNPF